MSCRSGFRPKFLQTVDSWQRACVRNLRRFTPHRLILDFQDLHEDLSDEFYELQFSALYLKIFTAVREVFGAEPSPALRQSSRSSSSQSWPWLRQYPKKLLNYTEAVARPDTLGGSDWDEVLLNAELRSYLIQAVILKSLEVEVFSHLLFGASQEHLDVLAREDEMLLSLDGFERSTLRAQTNASYLRVVKGGVTPLFWDEVDRITSQLLTLLMPLYILAGQEEWHEMRPPSVLYQQLHEIVAAAGFVAIAVRLSRSITRIEWLEPGEAYSFGPVSLSHDIYKDSLRRAKSEGKRNGRDYDFCPRVGISVTPNVTRHAPGHFNGRAGQAVYKVFKPHAVYFAGYLSSSLDAEAIEYKSLHTHIQECQHQRSRIRLINMLKLAFLINIFICIIFISLGYGIDPRPVGKMIKATVIVTGRCVFLLGRRCLQNQN